mmetsp:Transcript_12930/g.23980  ORF Transcript_12930/g.23980 Transcript_12930/m.23980 type:complete len:262 (+) Transcript_12930:77-862(+)
MIGLAKKREEARAAAEAEAQAAAAGSGAEGSVGGDGAGDGAAQGADDAKQGTAKPPAAPEMASATTGAGRGRGRGRGGVSIFGVHGAKVSSSKTGRKLRPGEIRVQKDVSELDGGDCANPVFPNPNDLMNFHVIISPDDGYWKGYQYTFDFVVPDMYPHEPPKVQCREKIYHPNIDLEGNVCLNILRADWKPVLDINAVIYGLIVLFVQPNPNDPLNHEAAECLRNDKIKFRDNVNRSLRGYSVNNEAFPPATPASKTKKT